MMIWDDQTLANELATQLDNHDFSQMPDEAHPLNKLLEAYEMLDTAVSPTDTLFLEDLHWILLGQPDKQVTVQKESWLKRFFTYQIPVPQIRFKPRPIFVAVMLLMICAMLISPLTFGSPRDTIHLPTEVVGYTAPHQPIEVVETERLNMLNGSREQMLDFSSGYRGEQGVGNRFSQSVDVSPSDSSTHYSFNTIQNDAYDRQVENSANESVETSVITDPFVVQNARLAMVVADVADAQADVLQIMEEQNGRIAHLEASQTNTGEPTAQIAIRVPAANFVDALNQLKPLGLEIISEQIDTRDVTADYIDLEARLGNLERTEVEIGELLSGAQERGEESDDILRIYDDLIGIREQIERIKGEMQLLEQQAAMSLITVTLINEETVIEIEPQSSEFDSSDVVNQAWTSFVGVLQSIASTFIWLGIYSPLVLIPLAIFFIGWRWLRPNELEYEQPGSADENDESPESQTQ